MKKLSILFGFLAGIASANAAVQVTPVQDKPAQLFLSSAKGSTEFPDPGQSPFGPFPFHVKWDFDASSGGHFSDVHLLEGGLPDSPWIGFEYYEQYNSNFVGNFQSWETFYNGGPPGRRELEDSSTNSSPIFSPPWEIGSLSKSLQYYGNATRNSKASVHLRTGGKTGSQRKNLFSMSASATGYHDLNAFDTWLGFYNWISPVDSYSIASNAITIPNFLPLDPDGNFYAGLEDNNEVDVTVKTSEKYYSFSETPIKHKLIIKANGIDVTDQHFREIVGAKDTFTCELDPPVTITSYKWSVPGKIIDDWVASTSEAHVVPVTNFTQSSISFAWVDAGDNRDVTCTIVVKGITLTAKTTVDVFRPQWTISTVVGAVACDHNYNQSSGEDWVHFGTGITNVGIGFIRHKIQYDGYKEWVQVGTESRRILKNGSWRKKEGTGLDHAYPYPDGGAENEANDSPGQTGENRDLTGVSEITVNDSYDMYFMFKPPVPGAAVWVPLRKVHWTWNGDGAFTNSVGTLISGSGHADSDQDTTDHPTWTRNLADDAFVNE